MQAKAEEGAAAVGRGEGRGGERGKKIASRDTQEMGEGGVVLEQSAGAMTCSCSVLLPPLTLLLLTNTTAMRSESDDAAGSASVGMAPGPAADDSARTDAIKTASNMPLPLLPPSYTTTPAACSISPTERTATCENSASGASGASGEVDGAGGRVRPPPSAQGAASCSSSAAGTKQLKTSLPPRHVPSFHSTRPLLL